MEKKIFQGTNSDSSIKMTDELIWLLSVRLVTSSVDIIKHSQACYPASQSLITQTT
jgi:hypothetical protein